MFEKASSQNGSLLQVKDGWNSSEIDPPVPPEKKK
jgi:hypothetical protein